MYRNMAPNVATHPTPLIDYIRAGSRSTVVMDFGIFILFYFPFLIVCRSLVAHLHFFSILQFYFHRIVVRPAPSAPIFRSETEEPSDGLSQIAARILATSFAYVS